MDGCTRNLARIRPWATPSSPWQGGPVLRHHGSSRGAGGQDVAACGCWRLGSSLQVSFGATQTCGRCPCSTLPWALRQKHRPSEICPLPPLSEPSARPRIATALAPLEGRANRRRTADPIPTHRGDAPKPPGVVGSPLRKVYVRPARSGSWRGVNDRSRCWASSGTRQTNDVTGSIRAGSNRGSQY